jgi:orotidine-5'-phosphate decarboxylase
MIFRARLLAAHDRSRSSLAIGLAPSPNRLPLSMQRYDDPLLPFGKAVIDSTHDLVCAYVFHLAAYLAPGASGAVALERTIAYVPASVIKILHGPFASADYNQAVDAFGADAVTLAHSVDPAVVTPYTQAPGSGAFVEARVEPDAQAVSAMVRSTGNPGQVGIYARVAPGHHTLSLLDEAVPDIDWYCEDAICLSVEDDFRDALRSAAEKLRQCSVGRGSN